jgi:hypothetical protein
MRRLAIVAALPLALAGCAADTSALLAPMEPTRESVAAHRRELTADEKDVISAAVMRKLGDTSQRDFKWFPLVVRSHNDVTDFCGLVSGDNVVGEYGITDGNANFRDYYAQLTFAGHGALSNVKIVAIGVTRSDNIPTSVDSTCMQGGYNVLG